MARDSRQCRYCGRHSERVALGLSCFHCGRVSRRSVIHWVVDFWTRWRKHVRGKTMKALGGGDKKPPYQYCIKTNCFRHAMYGDKCADHRIAELEESVQYGIDSLGSLILERDELQSRIEAVLKLADEWDGSVCECGTCFVCEQRRCGILLLEALGGSDE